MLQSYWLKNQKSESGATTVAGKQEGKSEHWTQRGVALKFYKESLPKYMADH